MVGNTKRPYRISRAPTRIQSLENDTLCIIFSFLDFFDLVCCSLVCKNWGAVINKSKLLQVLYRKKWQMGLLGTSHSPPEKSLNVYLEEMALENHRRALEQGRIDVDQWKAHSVGVDQCRKQMNLLLTGVGDKVMRLWSLESYECMGEYPVPDKSPLVDFDFDESKLVCLALVYAYGEGMEFEVYSPRVKEPFQRAYACDTVFLRLWLGVWMGQLVCLTCTANNVLRSSRSVTVSEVSSGQQVFILRLTSSKGIRTLCLNPSSQLLFAGTTDGYLFCWDLRKRRCVWET